jgi:formylglycine-generating enzyme required for sulfatase activity
MKVQFLNSIAVLTLALALPACSKSSGMIEVAANSAQGTTAKFYIDKYESSVKSKKKINSESGATETVLAAETKSGVLPESAVNFEEAKTYCSAAGKRICTVKEWLTACVGPNNYAASVQPTANTPAPIDEKCYVNRPPETSPYTGETDAPKLVKTGSNPQCFTATQKVYDLVGNVSEWALDEASSTGLAMGPNALSKVKDGKCSYFIQTDTNDDKVPDTPLDNYANEEVVGFRCCLDFTE